MNERNPKTTIALPKLILGLSMIFIGAIYSLDRLGYVDATTIFDYWPVILIAIGLGKIIQPGCSSSRFSGIVLISIGGLIMADRMDWMRVDAEDFFPLVLVLIGLRIAWHALMPRQEMVAGDSMSTVSATALLGGATRTNNSADFRGGDLIAVMGGSTIDLRGARIVNGPAVIDAFAFWGGIEIKVPEGWSVSLKGIPLLGGFEDNTGKNAASGLGVDPGPRQELIVKGFAVMGGVEVKN